MRVEEPRAGADSARLRAVEAVTIAARSLGLQVVSSPASDQLEICASHADGGDLSVVIECLRDDRPYYGTGNGLGLSCPQRIAKGRRAPAWSDGFLDVVARLLASPAFAGLASELSRPATDDGTPLAVPRSVDQAAPGTTGQLGNEFRRYTVFDLVRLGLKPAASLLVDNEEQASSLIEGAPAWALSDFAFARDRYDNLVRLDVPRSDNENWSEAGQRMLYIGRSQTEVDRIREIEGRLYRTRWWERWPFSSASLRLQEELGVGLGFPVCCVRAFARTLGGHSRHPDLIRSLMQLGWHMRPIEWRINYIVALQYALPFLLHVPCRADCRATIDQIDSAISLLYDESERATLEDILCQGAAVFSDDRIVLFRPLETADARGELRVANFDCPASAQLFARPTAPLDTSRGSNGPEQLRPADVERLRTRGRRLEVFARGTWRAYPVRTSWRAGAPTLVTPQPQR